MNLPSFAAGANRAGNEKHRGTGRASGVFDAVAPDTPQNAPEGLFSVPADLLGFVRSQTVTEVAEVLGMSRKTAWRLCKGHWPQDDRKVLRAWEAYKGRSTQRQSGWFLRRVLVDGAVWHANQAWTAPGLAARTHQTVAVARATATALVVQTLDLPSERIALRRL